MPGNASLRSLNRFAVLFCLLLLASSILAQQQPPLTEESQPPETREIVITLFGRTAHIRLSIGLLGLTVIFVLTVLLVAAFLFALIARRRARKLAKEIQARERAEEALRHSAEEYRLLFEKNPQPMWLCDRRDRRFLAVNDAAVQHYGYTEDEFLAMTLLDILPREDAAATKELAQTKEPAQDRLPARAAQKRDRLLTATPQGPDGEGADVPAGPVFPATSVRHKKKDGKLITVELKESPIRFADHDACLVMVTDITERTRLEEQIRRAQRLESIGRLAGGVAHDFNNLLTVINGYTQMAVDRLSPDDPVRLFLLEIRGAGERAGALTQQLLAFSRKQLVQPAVLNINLVIVDIQQMLRRLIREDIDLCTNLASDLGNVLGDAGQLEQIIVNLVVNSRDAMPGGGAIVVETSNVILDENYISAHASVQPGPYVMLAVTDTGTGMTPEVRDRIFEPFFTTKPPGEGTGLGLATVYGIVQQAGGSIWVYSEPGHGTTFKIYLPRVDKPLPQPHIVPKTDAHGNETILVVEDQAEVRNLALTALRNYGYTVYGASGGEEALSFVRSFTGAIHLLLTDVVMPGVNGRDLSHRIARLRPNLRVLFVSGYPDEAIAHRGVLDAGVAFLQKPFTPESLAEKVREVLGPRGAATATILVVDEEEAVRRFLRHSLTSAGYAVLEAANSRQALERLTGSSRVDLVITDVVTQGHEGVETIRLMRARHARLKIVAISGAFGSEPLRGAANKGAIATIGKPIERDNLLQVVRQVLQA